MGTDAKRKYAAELPASGARVGKKEPSLLDSQQYENSYRHRAGGDAGTE